jgi:Calcineurin-like phosphoesterase
MLCRMLKFSEEGAEADRQMRAIIFYLTTFGYIDGDFDDREKHFVREYIRGLVSQRVHAAVDAADEALRQELTNRYTTHFHEVFLGIDEQVRDTFTEAVAEGEDPNQFVHARLKLRCYEIFKSFDAQSQNRLLEAIDELIQADGEAHPSELKFRGELANLLEEEMAFELIADDAPSRVEVQARTSLVPPALDDPFLEPIEVHYSREPEKLAAQLQADRVLIQEVLRLLEAQRKAGEGRLGSAKNVSEFHTPGRFLDGYVYVETPDPNQAYEITVVGDLHGCYSCLKAVVMQSRFFEKLEAYRRAPKQNPCPRLVFLGDYIDRGKYSYHGVLRAVMQLFAAAPDHVSVLRGNHEYYVSFKGRVYGGVKPAEAINTLQPHVGDDAVFSEYMALFESLPNMLLFDRFLFVHGGIARDRLLRERHVNLASLNDPDIRFQMMWSDPSSADVIPYSLQEQSSRFPFGRLQCQAFLQKIGCHTLIRGHEKIDEGFRRVYDDSHQLLISLFSAGGSHNADLPVDSSYRSVTPMALTIHYQAGVSRVVPFRIAYEDYNSPERNAFLRSPAEIEHRVA